MPGFRWPSEAEEAAWGSRSPLGWTLQASKGRAGWLRDKAWRQTQLDTSRRPHLLLLYLVQFPALSRSQETD